MLEIGGWALIEIMQRYAHLSPNHLTEHAYKIDGAIGIYVTNLVLLKKVAEGLSNSNITYKLYIKTVEEIWQDTWESADDWFQP